MVTLSLLRHAKSSWHRRSLADLDRPLAPRGVKAAPAMGRYMRANDVAPDLILCSPARRTRDTLDLILPYLQSRPDILFEDDLYPASPDDILTCLRDLRDPHGHVMVIAHNPGLRTVARSLAGRGEPQLVAELDGKFPTCGLAVLSFANGWGTIAPGQGELCLFMAPKRLPGEVQ